MRRAQQVAFALVLALAVGTSPALVTRYLDGDVAFGTSRERVYAARLAAARDDLLARAGGGQPIDVGFVTDAVEPQRLYDFWLARYAVRPAQLRFTTEAPLLLGVFVSPTAATEQAAARGLAVVRDYGNGTLLLDGPQAAPGRRR